jgi:hypothetical protein
MRKAYDSPRIWTEKYFETSALSCAKTTDPPPGSWHFGSAYDTFTGHLSGGFGASASVSGSVGVGFGSGGTTMSYRYGAAGGLCLTWVTFSS